MAVRSLNDLGLAILPWLTPMTLGGMRSAEPKILGLPIEQVEVLRDRV
jgi:hypothetical protein